MKKYIFCLSLFVLPYVACENILVQPKKRESVAKLKEQLAQDFEFVIQHSTVSIRQLTGLIDQIVLGVKQLAGQQEGVLATSDKKVLQSYQEKVNELKKMLETIENSCNLDVN